MGYLVRVVGGFFLDIIETVVVALSIFLIVYLFFMQPHQVNGQSMLPSFEDREYLLTDKVSYKRRFPERGEIVVFHAPEGAGCPKGIGCDFIKRIIAIPGDRVELEGGKVVVNNLVVGEPYLLNGTITQPGAYIRGRFVVLGADEYFVLGDNRDHSSDSRTWGPIMEKDIVGRVFFRYWPPGKAGLLKNEPLESFGN